MCNRFFRQPGGAMDEDWFDYVVADLEDIIACEPSVHSAGPSVGVISVPDGEVPSEPLESSGWALPAVSEVSRDSWEKIDGLDEFSESGEPWVATATKDTADDVAVGASMFDVILQQAHMSNVLAAQSILPWENGIHAAIFSDDFQLLPSGLPEVAIPPASSTGEPEQSADPIAVVQEQLKRKQVGSIADKVIKAVSDIDHKRQIENLWDRALNTWILVYTCVAFSGHIGTRIWQKLEQDVVGARSIIRDVVGNKAPRTVNKRAGSMLSLFDWLHGQQKFTWPLVPEHVLEYMGECPVKDRGYTKGKTLMEAFKFCKHVMCFDDLQIADDPQLLGRSKRLDSGKTDIKRARPFKLEEVKRMEAYMIGDLSPRDRYLMGCALFYMYSRSRWSDLSMVQFVELDSQEVDGEQFGFFESSTKYQKTATSALKRALEMPLVAPVMGCTSVEWCHIWV